VRGRTKAALVAFCAVVAVLLVGPTLIVIPTSFNDAKSFAFPPEGLSLRWYENFFSDESWYSAFLASLRIALLVTVVSTVAGTAAAFGLVRGRIPFKPVVSAFLLAPAVVPVVVIAIALYAVFLPRQLVGTTQGFLLAHCVLAIPFVVVTVSASLRTYDRRLELAAASLGASAMTTLFKITLPLIAPGVLSGALFAFITSFDEVAVSLFLQSPDLNTLPVQMYTSMTREVDPTIAAASTLILTLTTALLLISFVLGGRRHGS
jgi:putative spermidine/putrescine transport system permease protein